LGDLGVDGKITVIKKQCVRMWTGFIWIRTGTNVWLHGYEAPGSIKGREFEKLSDYSLINMEYASRS